jgi:hypothetical protein
MWKWALAADVTLLVAFYQVVMGRMRSLPPTIPWSGGDVAGLMTWAAVALALANVAAAICVRGMRRRESSAQTALTLMASAFTFMIALGMFVVVLFSLFAQY